MVLELHFQEGFCGEDVEIIVDDRVVTRMRLQTRMQTGLADIEKLMLSDNETKHEVQIVIAELGQVHRFSVMGIDANVGKSVDVPKVQQKYVLFNLVDGKLTGRSINTSPGYL